jgi:hypothetical protein
MNHKIKRVIQVFALKVLRAINQTPKDQNHNEYEKECISIVKALILQEDSVLLMSPLSGKRFIKSDTNQLFIIIEAQTITIVNHQYSYNINAWGKTLERIVSMFDVEVEKRRTAMEMEIRSNVKHSLSNIYKTLMHEKV